MKIYLSFTLLVIQSVFYSCSLRSSSYWESETKKMRDCQASWRFIDLDKAQEVTVLLFQGKSRFHLYAYPNLIIGVTSLNDTIGILDKDFSEPLISGDRILLTAQNWSEKEKDILKPLFTLYNSSVENDLYCKVSTVFYGKITRTKG